MHDPDPEFEQPARPGGCRQGGTCDGSGWVQVSRRYVDHYVPMPADLPLDADEDAQKAYDAAVRRALDERERRYSSVYPCKACRVAEFFRWAGGHWDSNHSRLACEECRPANARARR